MAKATAETHREFTLVLSETEVASLLNFMNEQCLDYYVGMRDLLATLSDTFYG